MPKLVVVGYGPGISHATALRFGREGYAVALIGRSQERLSGGVAELATAGVTASAFPADASDPAALTAALRLARAAHGPVAALLWTAFRNGDVADVTTADPAAVTRVFDVGVIGLLAAVQEVRDDLAAAGGAVLVANGAVGEPTEVADGYATALGIDGTALENAAKSKLVGVLAARLRPAGIAVGQITVSGSVRGTATASATAIDPADIADGFWAVVRDRGPVRRTMTE